jgi:hypothetical protein
MASWNKQQTTHHVGPRFRLGAHIKIKVMSLFGFCFGFFFFFKVGWLVRPTAHKKEAN